MIFRLKNFSVVCAVMLLASASSWHNSAIASINSQSQLIAQGGVSTNNAKQHAVFKPILPKLKQKTQIPIILPKLIPGVEREDPLYAILENATPKKYEILLGFSPDCTGGTACRLGIVTAEAVTSKTPRLTGKTVSLAKGITGYFVDFSCGANCSDATLTWRQKGVQYAVGLKAGDRTSLIKMANSAINP
ncbi:hypothetical protein [Calothrix sp. PCC 7507]|uniref:hypothetical protein n=1 Tax=Calothrix sp. PCC 7507 TaxID=99598 RepID=UPI00029F1F67|nr:hypothetical protein [Calothrix sp. PCC 7507]AFY31529.1 hypothetical protein Cal7507_1053 [Calothrix sp. PCC 7507]